MNKVIVVGGGKGGVGKSSVTIGVVDMLLTRGEKVVLIESDDSNPDTYKVLNTLTKSEICNLDTEEGHIKLCNIIEDAKDAYVVLNTAARATAGMIQHGGILVDTVRELQRDLIMLWPINRQRDSLELLSEFLDNCEGYKATVVIKNTYFGEPSKFIRYDNSKTKSRVTATVNFPELNDLLSDKLNDKRWALNNAEGLTIAERSVLQRYRNAIQDALGKLL
jgi:hypothetical protein